MWDGWLISSQTCLGKNGVGVEQVVLPFVGKIASAEAGEGKFRKIIFLLAAGGGDGYNSNFCYLVGPVFLSV